MAGNEHYLTEMYKKLNQESSTEEKKEKTQNDKSIQLSYMEQKEIPEDKTTTVKSMRFSHQNTREIPKSDKYFKNADPNKRKYYETLRNSKIKLYKTDCQESSFRESSGGYYARETKPKAKLGYNRLLDICSKDSTEIITILSNEYFGFEELINSNLKPDLLILTVRALARACKSEFQANKASLLSMIWQASYLEQLEQHVLRMPTDRNLKRRQGMRDFITDLLILFESVINILPNTASEKFRKIFINVDMMIKAVENYQKINLEEQTKQFLFLEKQLTNIIEERERKEPQKCSNGLLETPPDNFREKSIYPTLEELFAKEPPFVRPNIIKGAYLNVDHYLDIQFRLLREDFMGPLREGVCQIAKMSSDFNVKKNVENVRVYKNVSFENMKVSSDHIGHVVHFNKDKTLHINWENSKRFIYGTLLIFTNDNFKHVHFGSVLERDIEELKKGFITVVLYDACNIQNMHEADFLMLESEVYFEPYKLVMEALQAMDIASFPMEKYIISVQNESAPPKYLLQDRDCIYDVEGHKINVLCENSWPDEIVLGLDKSQLAAFRAALTHEFVVIQGPPGTGKTFLGLKIAKVLMKNSLVWNINRTSNAAETEYQQNINRTPILVVCFTNHALDQFLEGLLPGRNIVRVGGQSKSDKLNQYNLKEIRRRFDYTNKCSHLKRDYHLRMERIMQKIQNIQSDLKEMKENSGVISFTYFGGVLSDQDIGLNDESLTKIWFQCNGLNEDSVMKEWLLEGIYDFPVDMEHNGQNNIENIDNENVQDTCPTLLYSVDLHELVRQAIYYQSKYQELNKIPQSNEAENMKKYYMFEYSELWKEYHYFSSCLKKKYDKSTEYIEGLHSVHNLWELCPDDRWVLYKDWLRICRINMQNKIYQLQNDYQRYFKQHEELQHICDREILESSHVVGMTTTCAARLHPLLRALKPKIVIVEEAAEVLESHVVVSVTNQCDHLILIGDHQQLRPTTAVYKLARQFHFDISLFERMVKNGMHCHSLAKQHRMRPEIVKLIVPVIYPHLQNDKCVYEYPPVRGITKSLFFISHNVPEEEDVDNMSHRNAHEAKFLLALCRHLLWQGYKAEEITVLTTYKGQMFYMQQKKKSMEILTDVKITVVDNYQGEENKIILLSLVRSNELSKIGFLKIENRVCVALSRAKKGLYIIGNMDNLVASSKIWPQIKKSLLELDSFGTHLSLQCQLHPNQITLVSCEKDFTKVPEGGCSLLCEAALECGHQCESICHVNNRDHKQHKCHRKCERVPQKCPIGHPCPKMCYEDCGICEVKMERQLLCGHKKELPCHVDYEKYFCEEMVEVQLPACEHLVKKPCSSDIQTFQCTFPCMDRPQCGHSCTQLCHVSRDPDHIEYKCEKQCRRKNTLCNMNHLCTKLCHEECGVCNFEVKKNFPYCNHSLIMRCHEDPHLKECQRACERTLDCGHPCPKICYEDCGGCPIMVEKTITFCGHNISIQCGNTPLHSLCEAPCARRLACGHQCTKLCGEDCETQCTAKIECPVQSPCGHSIKMTCYLQEDVEKNLDEILELCQSPCGKTLACEHSCRGSCGECIQGRIHIACLEACGRTLICGHKCRVSCSMSCPPCRAKCIYRCKHSRCSRQCGEPCVQCKERCEWACEHLRCTKLCYELCDREPCYKPCKKFLRCGHECIGFCGEPCPPLCRICNEQEVKEIFFGTEDDDGARFIYLVDCKHTFESKGLEMWFKQHDNEVMLKTCPRCKSYIMLTERFSKYIKMTSKDVSRVKNKIFGNMAALNDERIQLEIDFLHFIRSRVGLDVYMKERSKIYCEMFETCQKLLSGMRRGRRIYLGKVEFQSLKGQIEIFKSILDTVYQIILKPPSHLKVEYEKKLFLYYDRILKNVLDRGTRLCAQEFADFNRECKRFGIFTELAVIQNSSNFSMKLQDADIKSLYEEVCLIMKSVDIFPEAKYQELRNKIDVLHKNGGFTYSLTDRERKEIMIAMDYKQGHWYKCPNGHIYCIGECGRAWEIGQCPECKETIGGSGHRLLAGNAEAFEMYGGVRTNSLL